jgi:hypothetical protein
MVGVDTELRGAQVQNVNYFRLTESENTGRETDNEKPD